MRYTLLVLALIGAPALAQVNRCANGVYQQDPCPGAAIVKAAPKPQPSAVGPGKALCEAAAPGAFKDPDSMKIGDVRRAPDSVAAMYKVPVVYSMWINAKNSHGGYVGNKLYLCQVNADETHVLGVTGGL